LSISKAWEETKTVIARDGGLLTTIALALFVLPGVVSDVATPAAPSGMLPDFGYWTILTAISLVIALAGQLAVIRLAIGSRLTVGEAISHGVRRAPAYLAATLIWVLPFVIVAVLLVRNIGGEAQNTSPAAAVGMLALVCVMLFFAIRMLMTSAVASAEPVGPLVILRRSWELTGGHWWRLFGFFLIFLIGAIVSVVAVSAVSGVIAQLVFGGIDRLTVGGLFVALVTQIVSAAVSILLMVMIARIYVQLAGDGAAEVSVPTSGS
jgi:hypothetical protein